LAAASQGGIALDVLRLLWENRHNQLLIAKVSRETNINGVHTKVFSSSFFSQTKSLRSTKGLDALARHGFDLRAKLSTPISQVPRRTPFPQQPGATNGMSCIIAVTPCCRALPIGPFA
jgi:hypothetical protein